MNSDADIRPSIIVIQGQGLLKPDTGIVEIIFTQDPMGKVSYAEEEDFPGHKLWISSGYDEILEKFKVGELFLIDHYRETDKESDSYDTAKPENRAEFWAKGSAAKKIEDSRFISVIDSSLPDRSSGRLSYYSTIPQSQFMIASEGHVYGPFLASYTEDDVYALPNQCMSLNIGGGEIIKISLDELKKAGVYLAVNTESQAAPSGVITSLRDISLNCGKFIDKIDYISDAQLISYFAKHRVGAKGTATIARKPAEALKSAISEYAKVKNVVSDNHRLERINCILDQYLSKPDPGLEIIDRWLDSPSGKQFVKELVEKNPSIVESHTKELHFKKGQLENELYRLSDEKRRIESETATARSRVDQVRKEAEEEIALIRKKTAEEQQVERQKIMADLEQRIAEKEDRLKEVEEELKAQLAHLGDAKTVADLKDELNYNQRRYEEIKNSVSAQEKLLKNPDLPAEVIKTKAMLDLIHGSRFTEKTTPSIYKPSPRATATPKDGHSVIEAISGHFEDGGRYFTPEEMANLLITVQQSFMTVLKGLPGTGKTSTAIRLAQALHLANSQGTGSDFLNIPISRGWVSSRDFIGFYNSLKGIYQPARTGIFEFLSNGSSTEAGDVLRLVLLDEANLSPMEHYLSDFLGMFDPEGRERPIDTGNPDKDLRMLCVPKTTRFIATINNDSTTEPLSPRLCDRVPIISMDALDEHHEHVYSQVPLDGTIPYSSFEDFFGVRSADLEAGLYDEFPVKVDSALALFEDRSKEHGQTIPISKRKRIAIQNYHLVARKYMDETKASDFAMAQYLLPLINGFGGKFRSRLERITEHADRNSLSRSKEMLEEIIANGDAHVGSYSFF